MDSDRNLLSKCGCFGDMYLNQILGTDSIDQQENYINTTDIQTSHYCTLDQISKLTQMNASNFTVVSLNIQSINAKIDELRIIMNDINNSC